MPEFRKRARKHGESCELCSVDEHGRRPDAVTTIANVRCCEHHVVLLLAIALEAPPTRPRSMTARGPHV